VSAQPWLKFYPRDWRGDQALRAVSIAARGLWMEMLCIMHEASPYGHLVLGGLAVSNGVLARMSGLGADECGTLVAELESAGVFSRTRKGVIYSRRMTKDRSRAEKGRKAVKKRWAQKTESKGKISTPNRSPDRPPTTQKPEARYSEDKSSAGKPPDQVKELFDQGVALLTAAGHSERQARSMVGRWRKARTDAEVGRLLTEAAGKSAPIEWMEKAVAGQVERQNEHWAAVERKYLPQTTEIAQ
jgi:hypothetical protein